MYGFIEVSYIVTAQEYPVYEQKIEVTVNRKADKVWVQDTWEFCAPCREIDYLRMKTKELIKTILVFPFQWQ